MVVPGEEVSVDAAVVQTLDVVATGCAYVGFAANFTVTVADEEPASVGAVAEKYTPKLERPFGATEVSLRRLYFSNELLP